MRILRVIASMNPVNGGPCQGIRNSIPAQEYLGVQSEIVCFDARDADFLLKETLKVHAIGLAKGPYAYCRKLENWLQKNLLRFDVVIIHGIWLYNSFGTYRIWERVKKQFNKAPRLYVMPHGMLDPYFQKSKSRKLKAVRNWIFWKLIENKVINGADGILFTSKQEMLLARNSFRPYFPKAEINIGYGVQLPPGPDVNSTLEFLKKCPQVAGRSYWLFLSRIHPKKGVEELIKAYKNLRMEMGNVPDLVIAGPGMDSGFGKSMQKLSGENNCIYFSGMLQGPAKWGAFYGCEAFILPSHQENFGIAVVEALTCAKPVLISDQVNIWKEIENAKAGLICENSENGVYSMLKYWIMEPEERKDEMGINALNLFKSNYTTEKAALRMIECLQ